MHITRHKIGVEHFVRSQRPNPNRDKAPQDAPVDHVLFLNAQSMLNVSRRRLCGKVDAKTRAIWEAVRDTARMHEHPAISALAEFMVPMCVYRGVCPEPTACNLDLSKYAA